MINNSSTIIITGAAGFIGSCLVSYFNSRDINNLILVDDFSRQDKFPNLQNRRYIHKVEREDLFSWLNDENPAVDYVFHIGARTDTTEFNYAVHQHLNVDYSQKIWAYCQLNNLPLVYASSAATYGGGELGYKDDHGLVSKLQPLNAYGESKNEFDKWVLQQESTPPFWAGLKFFNVYGPNEYHKGRMASVIFHSFQQIRQTGKVKLFKSHRPDFLDGKQKRDFIYVKDIIGICCWLMDEQPASGLYNAGTGIARTFEDLVRATFAGIDVEPVIEFIDMPEDIRDKYQYFTEAHMEKLINAGYSKGFYSLEDGIGEYVRGYLVPGVFY